jgi:hypothetical protein
MIRQVATLHSTIILSDNTREISPEVLGLLQLFNLVWLMGTSGRDADAYISPMPMRVSLLQVVPTEQLMHASSARADIGYRGQIICKGSRGTII